MSISVEQFIKRWIGETQDARVFIDLEELLSGAYSAGRHRGMADAHAEYLSRMFKPKTLLEPNPPAEDLDFLESDIQIQFHEGCTISRPKLTHAYCETHQFYVDSEGKHIPDEHHSAGMKQCRECGVEKVLGHNKFCSIGLEEGRLES